MSQKMMSDSDMISFMMDFIKTDGDDKSKQIEDKGLEEFDREKTLKVNELKDVIRQVYEKKTKKAETEAAIKKSMAINKSRLEKIKAQQEIIGKVSDDSKQSLAAKLASEASKTKALYTKLVVQGLLMLLEDEVVVQCRQADVAMVTSILSDASTEYARVVQTETGATKKCALSIDTVNLPAAPQCLGGVVLTCQNGTIKINNTIDARLALVLEQDKPTIRKLLFPRVA